MGKDGVRVVTVNSVGREIREIDDARAEPGEGKRVQLTIDADVQRAAEEGFRIAGYNGSAVMLDPRNGEILALASVPAFDPNDFASGIAAKTWGQLMTDPLKPLQNRALQGRYAPGSVFKIAVAVAGLEEGRDHARHQLLLRRRRDLLRPLLQVPRRRPAPQHLAAPCDREVVQRLLLLGRQPARRRPHAQVGVGARPRRDVGHRPAQRDPGHHAVDRVEAAEIQREVVRRRDDLGLDRPGPGLGDADLAGGDGDDRRQRRHPPPAAPGPRRRRRQRRRLEAVPGAEAALGRHT